MECHYVNEIRRHLPIYNIIVVHRYCFELQMDTSCFFSPHSVYDVIGTFYTFYRNL